MTGVDMRGMSAILAAFALVTAGQALKPAVRLDPIDGIVEAFGTHEVLMLPGRTCSENRERIQRRSGAARNAERQADEQKRPAAPLPRFAG